MRKFNEIKSREDLAAFLGIPLSKFTYILYNKKVDSYYTSFEIPKKNGGKRPIHAPQTDLKEIQKRLADSLWEFHKEYVKNNNIQTNVSHAFEKEKGIISNAKIHRNKRFVLNIDLEDFFGSFHFGRVRGFFEKSNEFNLPIEVATIIAQLTCFQGCLPQGAPSSPIITNLISNMLDMKLIKIARRYKLDYTRYADDMTFSTNDPKFMDVDKTFLVYVTGEIVKYGFLINKDKTRLLFKDSRQEVTGLVVNKKINIKRDFYKKTRAMADALYKKGEFLIGDRKGTVKQLEGRFSFINQLDYYNNQIDHDNKHNVWSLSSREKQYQRFLFYKYFFANSKPLIVTEGKTDISYLKAALKKYYKEYPQLITKKGDTFVFNISFLRRTKRLEYFLGIQQDGADTMKNIYNFYTGTNNLPNLYKHFRELSIIKSINPVILVFDNEQESEKPLKKFINHAKIEKKPLPHRYTNITDNLYLLTNPLVKGMKECEIEDLFDETVLLQNIGGKTFSRLKDFDEKKYYGKAIFSEFIIKNYSTIDFSEFIPMLDDMSKVVSEHKKQK